MFVYANFLFIKPREIGSPARVFIWMIQLPALKSSGTYEKGPYFGATDPSNMNGDGGVCICACARLCARACAGVYSRDGNDNN